MDLSLRKVLAQTCPWAPSGLSQRPAGCSRAAAEEEPGCRAWAQRTAEGQPRGPAPSPSPQTPDPLGRPGPGQHRRLASSACLSQGPRSRAVSLIHPRRTREGRAGSQGQHTRGGAPRRCSSQHGRQGARSRSAVRVGDPWTGVTLGIPGLVAEQPFRRRAVSRHTHNLPCCGAGGEA